MRTIPSLIAIATAATAVAVPLPGQAHEERTIDIRVDRRIELISIVFRLAGNPEYRQPKVTAYADAVDGWFGEFEDHPVVQRARRLRRERGVSFDAPMSFAVHLVDAPGELRFAVPFEPWPRDLDARWTASEAKGFLRDANRFAKQAKLDDFLDEHQELHELACTRLREVLDAHARFDWFDGFFGARPRARFVLCVSLLDGPSNYGPRFGGKSGEETLYSVLGAWLVDDAGKPTFDESVVATIVHEFCHSYCNALVDAHQDELRAAGEALWPHVEAGMRAQAYANWQTMLRESLVRACVARYRLAIEGERAMRAEIAEQQQRDFPWTGDLADLLGEYEADREQFAELSSFMPRVVAFFGDYAPTLEAELAQLPHVVSIVPANGQQDVDPTLDAIVVTFDRPMLDGCWAVVGGGPHFPELTGKPAYDESCMVLTLPVRLKPDWSYELWLNRGKFDSFQSAGRQKLRPVHVTFETRGR